MDRFISFSRNVTFWVGHNCIAFDCPVLSKLLGIVFDSTRVLDTLVVARLLNYNQPGGNSLENWGRILKKHKGYIKDFSVFTPEMLEYCKQDVDITYALFRHFEGHILSKNWERALRLEHETAWLCNELQENGFGFNREQSEILHKEISNKITNLEDAFSLLFPPRARFKRLIQPKATKKGTLNLQDFRWLIPKELDATDGHNAGGIPLVYTVSEDLSREIVRPEDEILLGPDLSPYTAGADFSLVEYREFNPGSPQQCVERLWEAGWEPTEKTKGHLQAERDGDLEALGHFRVYGWKISDTNLRTLPQQAPEAIRSLVEWLTLNARVKSLETWWASMRPSGAFWRVHGKFNHIGSWVHRMSHAEPNMANIPREIGRDGLVAAYGKEFRSLWKAPEGSLLVGTDADSIQLRVLAHYMNDEKFTKALVSGRKEDGTDPHTLNQKALGPVCNSRDVAKTYIYAWLLGAGRGKVAQILNTNPREAGKATDRFIEFYPGLKRLRTRIIPEDARRGYFVGFDGRKVICHDEHYMLAGYLQNGEAVIMKLAAQIWHARLATEKIIKGLDWMFVDFVHDEFVTEVKLGLDNDPGLCYYIGTVQAEAIAEAGRQLGLLCPMKGNFKVGETWYDVH